MKNLKLLINRIPARRSAALLELSAVVRHNVSGEPSGEGTAALA